MLENLKRFENVFLKIIPVLNLRCENPKKQNFVSRFRVDACQNDVLDIFLVHESFHKLYSNNKNISATARRYEK